MSFFFPIGSNSNSERNAFLKMKLFVVNLKKRAALFVFLVYLNYFPKLI